MSYNDHLVVVTTYEIPDSPEKSIDAVIGSNIGGVAALKEKRFTGIQRKPAAWIAP